MPTDQGMQLASKALQWGAAVAALTMTVSLLKLGETSLAVGLIPSPWDKLAHAGTFGSIAFLLWLGCGRRALVACATAAFALACYDEWRQLMLPGREADIQDLIANTIGILAAAWVARQLSSKEIS